MTDRVARDRMSEAVRSYMRDQITAFELDEQLSEIRGETHDETVLAIARELWIYYDDLTDHGIVASKQGWDYFTRLLLLLASDAEISVARVWQKQLVTQFVAAFCLACLAIITFRNGVGPGLFLWACPFGI